MSRKWKVYIAWNGNVTIMTADDSAVIEGRLTRNQAQAIVDAHNATIDEQEIEQDAIDTAGDIARLRATALMCGPFGNNPPACDEIEQTDDTKGVWD